MIDDNVGLPNKDWREVKWLHRDTLSTVQTRLLFYCCHFYAQQSNKIRMQNIAITKLWNSSGIYELHGSFPFSDCQNQIQGLSTTTWRIYKENL